MKAEAWQRPGHEQLTYVLHWNYCTPAQRTHQHTQFTLSLMSDITAMLLIIDGSDLQL